MSLKFPCKCALFLAWSATALAGVDAGRHVQDLETGRSPNRRYTIRVEQKPASEEKPNEIVYEVILRKTGQVLLSIPSQYSAGVEPDSHYLNPDRRYKFSDASGAWAKWNRASNLVALTEYPWHGYGQLYVAAIISTRKAVLLSLSLHGLTRCETGEKTQCATTDDNPWLDDRTLRFTCGGCGGHEIIVTVGANLRVKIKTIRPVNI
jgi:hypothetical protein